MTAAPPTILRAHAEQDHAAELEALARIDDRQRPPGWRLSPWAVVQYVLGGTLADGTAIVAKYIGDRRLVEIAVATLATDRALLLLGVPGTAKTWLSEHLRRRSAATRRSSSRARREPARTRSVTAGTTPGSCPRARAGTPSSRARSWSAWTAGRSSGSRS